MRLSQCRLAMTEPIDLVLSACVLLLGFHSKQSGDQVAKIANLGLH